MRENEDWGGGSDREALRFESFVMFDDGIFGCYRGTESSSIIHKRCLINSLLFHRKLLSSRRGFFSFPFKRQFPLSQKVTCKAFFLIDSSKLWVLNWPIFPAVLESTLSASNARRRLIKRARKTSSSLWVISKAFTQMKRLQFLIPLVTLSASPSADEAIRREAPWLMNICCDGLSRL